MKTRSLRWTPAAILVIAGSSQSLAGGPLVASVDLATLDGANGFVNVGIDMFDSSGIAIAPAGDVNGDGIGDIIIGASGGDPGGRNSAGETYVVFGGAGVGAGGALDLSTLDGTNGFVCNGIAADDGSGGSVASAGDVNGDGIDDLIIGAPTGDHGGLFNPGQAYVVFGGPGIGAGGSLELSSLDGTNGFACNGIAETDFAGRSVASAGDINSDGIDDLIIGAESVDSMTQFSIGQAYIIFGGPGIGAGGVIELSSLNGANGFVCNGANEFGQAGKNVAAAGDINGDGHDDFMISSENSDSGGVSNAGEVYVVFGGPGVGASGSFELSSLDGVNGFVCAGIAENDYSGGSIAHAGDINGDGIDDIIVGASLASGGGLSNSGESYVIFGGPGIGASGTLEYELLDGTNGFACIGVAANDASGRSVAAAGDINSDGFDDLIIGANSADPLGRNLAGASYIVYGGPGVGAGGTLDLSSINGATGFVCFGAAVQDRSGDVVAPAGDFNNDGISDVLIGAFTADPNGNFSAGETYVIFGSPTNIWGGPAGGAYDDGANWLTGIVPSGGMVFIEPAFGGTIAGPAGALFVDSLELGAGAGVATLELQQGSIINIADDFTISGSGAVSGSGTLVADSDFTNDGLIDAAELMIIAAGGLTNNGEIAVETFGSVVAAESLDLFGALANSATGVVNVRGEADVDFVDGATNDGEFRFAFANANVGGSLVNNDRVAVSSGSQVVFQDAVSNNSSDGFTIAGGSVAVFFGPFDGSGIGDSGTAQFEGTVSMALTAGGASFGGDVAFGATSELVIELGGSVAGSEFTTIDIAGLLQLGSGELTVELVNGYTPQVGDVFDVLDFAGLTGSFGAITLPTLPGSLEFDTSDLLTDGVLRVVSSCPADINGDGVIDTADLGILISAFGSASAASDINGDSVVDTADLGILIGAFGTNCD